MTLCTQRFIRQNAGLAVSFFLLAFGVVGEGPPHRFTELGLRPATRAAEKAKLYSTTSFSGPAS